jgi:putative spermidine/putrescine transport system permease protein
MTTTMVSEAVAEKAEPQRSGRHTNLLLLAPGILWMTLFLVVPILMMVYVSFWTQTTFKIEPILTTKSWVTFFSSDTYVDALWTTLRIWFTVLVATLVVGYPTALFVGLLVRNKTLQTVLLVLCVIPFWTSFLIRVLAWRPMLGTEGAINLILLKLGIIHAPIEALLFSDLSVVIGMTQIYCVFMVGPIAFMLARIDPNIIEAARDLGATPWQTFRHVVLPIILPSVIGIGLFGFTLSWDELARSSQAIGSVNTLPLELQGLTTTVTKPDIYALGTLTSAVSFVVIFTALAVILLLQARQRRRGSDAGKVMV